MLSTRLAWVVLVGLLVTHDARLFSRLRAESQALPVGDLISYKRDVRPILQANCQGCHQPAKAEGEYVMTNFDRLLRGGESGDVAIVAGEPENSHLIDLITPMDGEAEMPRGRQPLGDAERQLIAEWIRQGAKDDSSARGAIYDQAHPPHYHRLPSITSLDYSPDGKMLAVAGFHEVTLFNSNGSSRIARLIGLSPRIESVQFSPDGRLLAVTGGSPSEAGEVQIWDMESFELVLSVPIAFDTLRGASWSPNGKLLAFGCTDKSVRVMDVETGKIIFQQAANNDWVLGTIFSSDGSHLASVSRDQTVKLSEVATQQLVDNITSVSEGALKGGIHCVARHPVRDEIVFGGADGIPKIYRMFGVVNRQRDGDENLLWNLPPLSGRIFAIDISQDGRRIAVGSSSDNGGELHVYGMEQNPIIPAEIQKILNRPPRVRKPAEQKQLAEHFKQGVEVLAETQIPGSGVFAVAIHPAGQHVAIAGGDGMVRLVDLRSGMVDRQFAPVELDVAVVSPVRNSDSQELGAPQSESQLLEEKIPADTHIVSLQVTPPQLQLGSMTDYAQLVVTAALSNGEIMDATRLSRIAVDGSRLSVTSTGLVKPLHDGSTEILVSLRDQTLRVPVEISNTTTVLRPDFQRDVAPVISKLGCNLGKCHGARDGKNGFKLSLRGYDSVSDIRSLTDDLACRRINRASPKDSLMLAKPTGQLPHEGGRVLRENSNYYRILHTWIAEGASLNVSTSKVSKLDVYPTDPVVQQVGSRQQLRIVATYGDGVKRDVTHEAFVESGNVKVAKEVEGHAALVEVLRRGEASILVRYEGTYASTTLTVMGDREGFVWQSPSSNNPIDDFVWEKLQRTKTLPSSLCDDYEFLRRVYLDLTGLPPTPEQIRKFISADGDSRAKRDELIKQLVGSHEYVEHRSNKWADLLQVNEKFLGRQGATDFRQWIREEIASNTPYDQFARKLLTAIGSNKDNPAAAYYKILREPKKLMANTTHLFLATRFTCNECHDHPFERWTQDNYYQMSSWFAQVGFKKDDASGDKQIKTNSAEPAYPLYEVVADKHEGDVTHLRTSQIAEPAFPFACNYESPKDSTRRQQMAAWITSPDNSYFARSFANRMWGYFMGRGLIEPLDDIRAGNPASNPQLLDFLTQEFIHSGFNVQHLVRLICQSRTYQLSSQTNPWNHDDELNYSHRIPRRLPAEVIYDSIYQATGARSEFPGVPKGTRAASLPDVGIQLTDNFLSNMGRPARESSCECERNVDLQLGVVLALVNCPTVNDAIGAQDNEITALATSTITDSELVNEMFMRVLNRPASRDELDAGLSVFEAIETQHQLLENQLDVLDKQTSHAYQQAEQLRLAELARVNREFTSYQQRQEPDRARQEQQQRELIADAKAALNDYQNQMPQKLSQWEQDQRDSTIWTALDPIELIADHERTVFELQPDKSVFVKDEYGKGEFGNGAYRLLAKTGLSKITGLRLDALADARMPQQGPGRHAGNFVLSELELHRAPAEMGTAAVLAEWDFEQAPGSWMPMSNNELSVSEGRLLVKSAGAYPAMATPVEAEAGHFTLEIVAKIKDQAMMRIYWSTIGMTKFEKRRSQRHGVVAGNEEWQSYRFHFKTELALAGIRLDLDKKDGQVPVESIRLLRYEPQFQPTTWASADAGSREDFDIDRAIDGNSSGDYGWSIAEVGHDHAAIFAANEPVEHSEEGLVRVTLHHNYGDGSHSLGKFRVSLTDSLQPLSLGINSSIAELLGIPSDKRSQQQQTELATYHREHDEALRQLQKAVGRVEQPLPPNPQLAMFEQRIKELSQALPVDSQVLKFQNKVALSRRQRDAKRITAAQDLAWALINNPAFLYNH